MADDMIIANKSREHTDLSDYLREPFNRLRNELDHLFDEFPPRFPAARFGSRYLSSIPAIEMTKSEDSYAICVEVPGIPHDQIDLSIDDEMLIIKGEKKDEREESDSDFSVSERSYGSFERRVSLPQDAVVDSIEASTDNGVIKITIPRNKEAAPERRQIEIQTS